VFPTVSRCGFSHAQESGAPGRRAEREPGEVRDQRDARRGGEQRHGSGQHEEHGDASPAAQREPTENRVGDRVPRQQIPQQAEDGTARAEDHRPRAEDARERHLRESGEHADRREEQVEPHRRRHALDCEADQHEDDRVRDEVTDARVGVDVR